MPLPPNSPQPPPPSWNYPSYPPPPLVHEPVRDEMGCFLKGCLTVFFILLILAVLAACALYYGSFKLRDHYTTDHPISITTFPTTPENIPDPRYDALMQRLKDFQNSVNLNQAATLEMTVDELNLLIAKSPDFKPAKGKLFFTKIENGQLFADVSIPLSTLNLAALKDRWVNGNMGFEIGFDNGAPNIQLTQLEINNQKINGTFLNSFSDQFNKELRKGFLDKSGKQTKAEIFFHRIHDIDLKDHKIIITTLSSTNSQSESDEPTATAIHPSFYSIYPSEYSNLYSVNFALVDRISATF